MSNPKSVDPAIVEAKLRAIAKAARHEFPTADIDVILREIEEGRRLPPSRRAEDGAEGTSAPTQAS